MVINNMEVDDNQENNTTTTGGTPLERKSRYRNLLNKTEAIQEADNAGLQTVTEVGDILREANALNSEVDIEDRVQNADETLLDCMVLSSASSILRRCIESVDVFTTTYDSLEFANRLIAFIKQDDNEDEQERSLTNLFDEARSIIPKVPEYNYVYGAYDLNNLPQPKPKKERIKTVKENLKKKEPTKVTNLDKEEEGIEQIVSTLFDVLEEAYNRNDERPINYYDYVIDTSSYSNTIENIFYFSFLIRDGKAHLDLDKNGNPIIKPMRKRALKEFRQNDGKNSQLITCIPMDMWEGFKRPGLLQKHRKE